MAAEDTPGHLAVLHSQRVRLRAEMKLPGRAWLQYEVREAEDGTARLEQTAAFIPKGLPAAPSAWEQRGPVSVGLGTQTESPWRGARRAQVVPEGIWAGFPLPRE